MDQPWQIRDLSHADENDMILYLFEKQKPSHYEYKGEVEIAVEPFREKQKDADDEERKTYVFPLKIK